MKNLLTFGLLALAAILPSCKKGDLLNPIKIEPQAGVSTTVRDSTYYVYPTGYDKTNSFIKPTYLGIPIYLDAKNDVLNVAFTTTINTLLPDGIPLGLKHPEYLTSAAVNTINVITQSDIYVTFISTNKGYQKTLAYYTYPTNQPPTASSGGYIHGAMDKITYIFPNANSTTTNGGLITGNRVKLGNFSPGTSIGFVLILNSWNAVDVNPDNTKFYSQDKLNPETATDLKRHAILLYSKLDDLYIIGFEWNNREGRSDDDFNDLVFYIKGDKANSIANNNVALIGNTDN